MRYLFNGKKCLLIMMMVLAVLLVPQVSRADTNTVEYIDFMGLILFEGEINGYEGMFLLDTGADTSIIDTRIVEKAGLERITSPLGILGLGGIDQYKVDKIVIGEWYFNDVELIGIDLSIIDKYLGLELIGLVGGDFLKDYTLHIDYQKSIFTLSDNPPELRSDSVVVPFDMRDHLVFVKARSGSDTKLRTFLVDTGATSTVYFKNRMEESNPDYRSWPRSLGWIEASFMGQKEVDLFLMPSFWVGEMELQSMVTIVSEQGLLGLGINLISGSPTHGIIGWTFLKNFKVTFDYPRRRLILEPYEYYIERWPHLFDTVGLMVSFDGGKPVVEHVIPDTPAAKTSVQKGDWLLMVNGIDVTDRNGLEISEMVMGEPGTKVEFLFQRDGKKFRETMLRETLFKE